MLLYSFLALTFFIAHSVDVWTPFTEATEEMMNGIELSQWYGLQQFGGNSGYSFYDDCERQGGLQKIRMKCGYNVESLQLQCARSTRYGKTWLSQRGYGNRWSRYSNYKTTQTDIDAKGITRIEIRASSSYISRIKFFKGSNVAFECGSSKKGQLYIVQSPTPNMQLCGLRGRARSVLTKIGAGWCYVRNNSWYRRYNRYRPRRTTRSPYRYRYRYNNRYNNRYRYRYRYYRPQRTTRSPYRYRYRYNRYNNRYRRTRSPNRFNNRYRYRYNYRPLRTTRSPWSNRNRNRNGYFGSQSLINDETRKPYHYYRYYSLQGMINDEEIDNIDTTEDIEDIEDVDTSTNIQEEEASTQMKESDNFETADDLENEKTTSTSTTATSNEYNIYGLSGGLMAVGGFIGITFVYLAKRENSDAIYEQIPDDEPDM